MQYITPHKTRLAGLTILCVSGLVFFTLTNPARLPLVLLVLPFMWLFTVIFWSVWLLLGLSTVLSPTRRRVLIAGATAMLPSLLLVFQSIHQLTARDVLLTVAFIGLAVFYVSRADFIK
jgi:phosphoglycerol transferase MdoB-like AlkP superfamily enzyme